MGNWGDFTPYKCSYNPTYNVFVGPTLDIIQVHVFKEKTRPAVQYAERSLAVCRKCESKQEGVALRLLVKLYCKDLF